jgi:hypothetical protein
MFGMLQSLTKAAVGLVVETPVALIKDAATLGGSINNQRRTYTGKALEKVSKNISDSTK